MRLGKLGFNPDEQYTNQSVLHFALKDNEEVIEHIDEMLLREIGYEVIKAIYETNEPYIVYVERNEQDVRDFGLDDFDDKIIKYHVYIKKLSEHNEEILYGGMR